MSDLPDQPSVTIKIAGRDRTFQWGNAAIYRLGCITMRPKGDYATVIAMLWATLVPADAADFPTPESLTTVISQKDAGRIYDEVIPKIKPDKSPNENGSKTRRSPSSS